MKGQDLKALKGRVEAVRYRDEVSGFTVFTVKALKKGMTVSCNGELETPPEKGSLVECFGYFDTNSKYKGIQFKVTNYLTACGGSAYDVTNFLISFTKHLGEEKARRIADTFGSDVERILEEEPEKLLEVEGIGDVIYQNIIEGWHANRGVRSITIFLKRLGLPDYQVKKIISHHGHNYEDVIKKDPYCLLQEGLGFSTCDYIAEKMGVPVDDPVRFRGFIRSCLKGEAQASGHLYLTGFQISELFNKQDEKSHRKFSRGSNTSASLEPHIKSLIDDGYALRDGEKIYDLDWFFYEAKCADHVARIAKDASPAKFKEIDVTGFLDNYQDEERVLNPSFTLSDQQRDAVASFIADKILVVTGGPGTGKTTIVKAFVKILKANNVNFSLAAPTGVASKRLGNTTGSDAYTIHRLLGYRGDDYWNLGSSNKLDSDVVIVDEFSMVDQLLFFRLLDALKSRTKLVLVGDAFQLPSVGPGNVLHELIASGSIKTIQLDKIHRQSETSDIVQVSQDIKEGRTDLRLIGVNDLTKDVVFLNTGKDVEKADKYLVNIAKSFVAKQKPGSFQVITPRNEGDLSVRSINDLLQESLNPKVDSLGREKRSISLGQDSSIRVGDRVIVTKNNYNLGVFNGDIGKVVSITKDSLVLKLENPGDNETVHIPLVKVREMVKLAYAVTVHRSQGMEYPVVIIPLIRSHGKMLLQRNLVYTALTRAKKKVFFLGQTSAMEMAIENNKIQDRNTVLSARIKKSLSGSVSLKPLLDIPAGVQNSRRVDSLRLSGGNARSARADMIDEGNDVDVS